MKRSSNPIASGKILIKNGRSYYFVNINDINFIESDGNYSRLFCDKRNFIVKKSLIFLEGKLGFFDMSGIIEKTMNSVAFIATPDLNDYVETDSEARKIAESYLFR